MISVSLMSERTFRMLLKLLNRMLLLMRRTGPGKIDSFRYPLVMTAEPVTPNDLARELATPPLAIRNCLRAKYGVLASRDETRWLLDAEQAADVRREFQRRAGN